MPGSNLVYIYSERGPSATEPDIDRLTPDRLLMAPLFINRLPWSRGYFLTVANRPIAPGDLLPQHCFRRFNGTYLDEQGRTLEGPVEPCGEWGLASFRMVDDGISEALGLPFAPD